jgi:hypothetical protein
MSTLSLKSITHGIVERPPRMLILGTEKVGKSSFAAGAPDCIFIPVRGETGIDAIDVPRFPVIESCDQLIEALKSLAEGGHNFKMVVIDSATTLDVLVSEHCCAEAGVALVSEIGGGFGAGKEAVRKKWNEITEILDYLREECDMGTILIGHVKVKKFHDPERASYDRYEFDVTEAIANDLVRWADFIGFANKNIGIREELQGFSKKNVKMKVEDLDPDTHYLYTRKSPSHPGGGRGIYGQLPSEIPLYWASLQEELNELRQPKVSKKAKK